MIKFNIPYNFDPKLLAGLNILQFNHDAIQSIYIPPYEHDYPCIRKNDIMPNEQEHLRQLELIQNQFPGKIQLLLQQPNDNFLMTGELLKKYLNFGIKKFCVGSLNQAKEIKNILPESEIVGSISMHINKENIEKYKNEYLQYFNSFVLDFSYNRDIYKIYNLPNYFKYILILNSTCHSQCQGDFHWFSNNYQNFDCPYKDKNTWSETSLIRPFDLSLFDPYIHSYKIVERGYPTRAILTSLLLYNNFQAFFPNSSPEESLYIKK